MESEAVCVAALDSVLQKSEELESNLRSWRAKLCIASTPSETGLNNISYIG